MVTALKWMQIQRYAFFSVCSWSEISVQSIVEKPQEHFCKVLGAFLFITLKIETLPTKLSLEPTSAAGEWAGLWHHNNQGSEIWANKMGWHLQLSGDFSDIRNHTTM